MKKVLGENHSNKLLNFTHGLDVDQRMYKEEITVQTAWIKELANKGYYNSDELQSLLNALSDAETEISDGSFDWKIEDEDIHMNIERYLSEKCGDLGKKVHLGRSRNDLVATTQRLFVHNLMTSLSNTLSETVEKIITVSEKNIDIIVPGMTHLQNGLPVRFSHCFLAHAQAYRRDLKKINFVKENALEILPLGAAAFSGTHLDIDLNLLANELGFDSCLLNSYDSVGDRDFILDALSTMAQIATHTLRLSNEIIYFGSSSVGLYKLPVNWTTGSSIMPNKRNPDTIEITRAKMARVIAACQEGFQTVSSVVPSYGSDLHELKRTFVRSFDELILTLDILNSFIAELEIDEETSKYLLEKGHILATDFANQKAEENNFNFREAYLETKSIVDQAIKSGKQIHDQEAWPKDISFHSSVEKRKNFGGTSKQSVLEQIKNLRLQSL